MNRNKQSGRGRGRGAGPSKAPMESEDQDLSFRTITKEIQNLSSSCMTWNERKALENKMMVQLGGKAPKKQRFPLSVARPCMKNQKQRDEKLMKERLALGRFGALLGDSSTNNKRFVDKRKPVEMGLKASAGTFVNGCLHVDRLLKSASSSHKEVDSNRLMEKNGKRKGGEGGKKNQKKNKNNKKGGGRGNRH